MEKDYIPTDRKIRQATVSKQAGRWFISCLVEDVEDKRIDTNNLTIGVDVGSLSLAVLSTGDVIRLGYFFIP